MPHCSLDFCTIMLPGFSSPSHGLAVNPPLPASSLLLLLLSGLLPLKEQPPFGFFVFFGGSMTCVQLFFVFFNKVRHTDIFRPPTNGFVADVFRLVPVIVAAWRQSRISTTIIYLYIFIYMYSFFFFVLLWSQAFLRASAFICHRTEWKKKRKKEKIAVHLPCVCGFLLTRFWIVGVPSLLFQRHPFFFPVCTDDDISEILDLFDASMEGWSLSDFHRCIKRQRCILGKEFYLGNAIHWNIHLLKKKNVGIWCKEKWGFTYEFRNSPNIQLH